MRPERVRLSRRRGEGATSLNSVNINAPVRILVRRQVFHVILYRCSFFYFYKVLLSSELPLDDASLRGTPTEEYLHSPWALKCMHVTRIVYSSVIAEVITFIVEMRPNCVMYICY
jgi:amino acid permease